MDSTLAPLPEAFLRRRDTGQKIGRSPLENDGGPPLAGGLLRPGGVAGADAHADAMPTGADSQWSLRGMSQLRWPAWRQNQDVDGNTAGAGSTTSAPAGAGRGGKHVQGYAGNGRGGGPSGHADGKIIPGRVVGPFGNGAGAADGSLPATSRLFGDADGADGEGGRRSGDSWRATGTAGAGGLHHPVRPLGGGASGGSSDWMPVMAIGSGTSSSATRWGGPPHPEIAGGNTASHAMDFPDRPAVKASPGRSAGAAHSSETAGFGYGASAWPPEQPTATAVNASGVGKSGHGNASEHGGRTGARGAGGLVSGGENDERRDIFAPASPFSGFDNATAGGSDGEEEEENPFA